jgi:hypothetical protein
MVSPTGEQAVLHIPDEVQSLKDEVNSLLLSEENDFDHDTHWETADESFGKDCSRP